MHNVDYLIGKLKEKVEFESVHIEELPAQTAKFGSLDNPLHPEISEGYLNSINIDHLYTHQADAINQIVRGKNVVIVSKTASGKTMCFNIPVVNHIISDISSTALYLFPTKALTQDQYKTLSSILKFTSQKITCSVYDGDTPRENRSKIRKQAHIILSNPDMLHYAILPYHKGWSRFLRNLRFIIIDEVHTYRGLFGCHVGLLLRRLLRICRHYGSMPQIICASATIANPKEHVEKLTNMNFEIVDKDGAPRGQKKFLIWNSPVISLDNRKSPISTCLQILPQLLKEGFKTICFARSRNAVEVVFSTLKKICPERVKRIEAYRGGYLPLERRKIEEHLFRGDTDIVISTNALELGIDIGSLDGCLLIGYPGSIASLWQQAGRSGRSSKESLAIFIAQDSPLDQYFAHYPEALFGATPEHAIIDTTNILLLTQHLQCALHELPIKIDDQIFFGSKMFAILQVLVEEGVANENIHDHTLPETKTYYLSPKVTYPAGDVNLRSIGSIFQVIDQSTNKVIGTVDTPGLYSTLYPEAIYLHQSISYQSIEVDFDRNRAMVKSFPVNYYTQPVCIVHIAGMIEIVEKKNWRISEIIFGDVRVIKDYIRFKKIKLLTKEILGYGSINLPSLILNTEAIKISIPQQLKTSENLYGVDFLYFGLVGMVNVLVNMMTLHVMCDLRDIEGFVGDLDAVYIYDQIENGGGFSEKAYSIIEDIMESAFKMLMNCACADGCPACVIPSTKHCQLEKEYEFRKEAAKYVFHVLLEKEPYDPDLSKVKDALKSKYTKSEISIPKLTKRELDKIRKGSMSDQIKSD